MQFGVNYGRELFERRHIAVVPGDQELGDFLDRGVHEQLAGKTKGAQLSHNSETLFQTSANYSSQGRLQGSNLECGDLSPLLI